MEREQDEDSEGQPMEKAAIEAIEKASRVVNEIYKAGVTETEKAFEVVNKVY